MAMVVQRGSSLWEFWRALLVFTVLKVARFSEAFVTLHANAVDSRRRSPMFMVAAFNLMQSPSRIRW